MMRWLFALAACMSIIFFPWPFAAALALISSLFIPMVPLAAGLFADMFYSAPQGSVLSFFTLYGAAATGIALFVRSRLKAGSMER